MSRPAVFMDRDGTVAHEVGYMVHPDRAALLPRSAEAVRRMRALGFATFVLTNQPETGGDGIGVWQLPARWRSRPVLMPGLRLGRALAIAPVNLGHDVDVITQDRLGALPASQHLLAIGR